MIPSMERFNMYDFFHYLLSGGIVFYGGMLGLLLGIFIISKIQKDNTRDILSFFAPAIPLFHAIARIGCLFTGCCYGIPFGWGISMYHSPDIIRFPVQLIECGCNVLIFVAIIILEKIGKKQYSLTTYLLSYACCRFILEFFRGDMERGVWFNCVSTSQIVSIVILLVLCVNFIIKRTHKVLAEHGLHN